MLKTLIATGLFLFVANGALAANSKYEAHFVPGQVKIASVVISVSEDVMAEKVEYDKTDVKQMKAVLYKKITSRLTNKKMMADDGARLELVITSLKPNRPTMAKYRSNETSVGYSSLALGFDSIALGGAGVKGKLIAADGTELGNVDFVWEENWLDQVMGASTWYDARRAFDRFSRRFVRDLQARPAS